MTPSSHQSLPTFGHVQQYHEEVGGDDSIVPSTPTLFAPRREGFPEVVSSPQVPSAGFIFSGSGEPPNTS